MQRQRANKPEFSTSVLGYKCVAVIMFAHLIYCLPLITLKVSPLVSLPFNDLNILEIQAQVTPSPTSIVGVNQLVGNSSFVLSTRSHVLQSQNKKGLFSTWSSTIASETLPWSAFKGATLLDWLRLISTPNVCRSLQRRCQFCWSVGDDTTRHKRKPLRQTLNSKVWSYKLKNKKNKNNHQTTN